MAGAACQIMTDTSVTKADGPMTEEQVDLLKKLAIDAFEPDAFSRRLTRSEAVQRIAALRAKLNLQDGPPHTL